MKKTQTILSYILLSITTLIASAWVFEHSGDIVKPTELIAAQESQKSDRLKPNAKTRDGFTIQLFFSDDKTAADNIKSKFDSQFINKYVCTVEWYEPNFKVFAGAFLTRAEAVALLYKCKDSFPRAMIVKTKI